MGIRKLAYLGLFLAVSVLVLGVTGQLQMNEDEEAEMVRIISVPAGYEQRKDVVEVVRQAIKGTGLDQFDEDDRSVEIASTTEGGSRSSRAIYGAAFRSSVADTFPAIAIIIFDGNETNTLVEFRRIEQNRRNSDIHDRVAQSLYAKWPNSSEIPISPDPNSSFDPSEYTEI